MSIAELSLIAPSPYRASVPRYVTRPSHRVYVRRRAGAMALLLAIVAVPAALVLPLATGRGGDPASAAAARPANAIPAVTYVVQPGDTLWSIADRFRGGADQIAYVDALVQANGGEASVLAGQRLTLP